MTRNGDAASAIREYLQQHGSQQLSREFQSNFDDVTFRNVNVDWKFDDVILTDYENDVMTRIQQLLTKQRKPVAVGDVINKINREFPVGAKYVFAQGEVAGIVRLLSRHTGMFVWNDVIIACDDRPPPTRAEYKQLEEIAELIRNGKNTLLHLSEILNQRNGLRAFGDQTRLKKFLQQHGQFFTLEPHTICYVREGIHPFSPIFDNKLTFKVQFRSPLKLQATPSAVHVESTRQYFVNVLKKGPMTIKKLDSELNKASAQVLVAITPKNKENVKIFIQTHCKGLIICNGTEARLVQNSKFEDFCKSLAGFAPKNTPAEIPVEEMDVPNSGRYAALGDYKATILTPKPPTRTNEIPIPTRIMNDTELEGFETVNRRKQPKRRDSHSSIGRGTAGVKQSQSIRGKRSQQGKNGGLDRNNHAGNGNKQKKVVSSKQVNGKPTPIKLLPKSQNLKTLALNKPPSSAKPAPAPGKPASSANLAPTPLTQQAPVVLIKTGKSKRSRKRSNKSNNEPTSPLTQDATSLGSSDINIEGKAKAAKPKEAKSRPSSAPVQTKEKGTRKGRKATGQRAEKVDQSSSAGNECKTPGLTKKSSRPKSAPVGSGKNKDLEKLSKVDLTPTDRQVRQTHIRETPNSNTIQGTGKKQNGKNNHSVSAKNTGLNNKTNQQQKPLSTISASSIQKEPLKTTNGKGIKSSTPIKATKTENSQSASGDSLKSIIDITAPLSTTRKSKLPDKPPSNGLPDVKNEILKILEHKENMNVNILYLRHLTASASGSTEFSDVSDFVKEITGSDVITMQGCVVERNEIEIEKQRESLKAKKKRSKSAKSQTPDSLVESMEPTNEKILLKTEYSPPVDGASGANVSSTVLSQSQNTQPPKPHIPTTSPNQENSTPLKITPNNTNPIPTYPSPHSVPGTTQSPEIPPPIILPPAQNNPILLPYLPYLLRPQNPRTIQPNLPNPLVNQDAFIAQLPGPLPPNQSIFSNLPQTNPEQQYPQQLPQFHPSRMFPALRNLSHQRYPPPPVLRNMRFTQLTHPTPEAYNEGNPPNPLHQRPTTNYQRSSSQLD